MVLQDKVCIITGGGSGIGSGSGTAVMMAQARAKIVLVGRTASKVEAIQKEIESTGGTAMAVALDVADYDAVHKMATKVLDTFGRVDVLVNNAGHSSYHRRVLTTTPKEIRGVIDSNLVGTIYCTKAVLPTMLEAKQGTIINVSSLAGVNASIMGGMVYGTAKAAVINFTEFLNNVGLMNTGVRASVVIPGEVDTPVLDNRLVPPPKEARAGMVAVQDAAEAITLIASLPDRANIPELIIRPTMQRDASETLLFP